MTWLNDLQEIMAVFVRQKALELSDAELLGALKSKDDDYSTEKLRRAVQLQSSSLFQLQENDETSFSVRLEPTVSFQSHQFVVHSRLG